LLPKGANLGHQLLILLLKPVQPLKHGLQIGRLPARC
jgi:hypothetical protein